MSVDCVYYSGGVRQPIEPGSLEEVAALPRRGGNFVWIELDDPTTDEVESVVGLDLGTLVRSRSVFDRELVQVEQIAAALEANFALISLRQNEIAAQQNRVVKQLTLVATVFLPLAFITGFFGQNFAWLVKHISSFESFLVVGISSLVISCVALLLWFRQGGLTD
jgi:Mg2+ and Co2+ transporter CorA